ncbi:LysR family transcriptional regulator [Neobacillus sp. PS3-34]|uniref:LysR family transcriptional regulator n=1 Tax=Neobacillus sp. PS3-34 TaxID=3070678 RepID=UPI0027E204E0|nr:LysR family transcriptional regulator [Neobacillus sp. PS3-34]WML48416.1 LysR family transcriptional regulator [Neobacillus sp. PS3-34]
MLNMMLLNYFVKAVENQSLNKAAKELYISQPALTKQLAQLEKQLNCKLFLRKPSGIEMTDAGRHLYEKAVFLLGQLNSLEKGMEKYAEKRSIRIGATPSIASNYVPTILTKFELHGFEVSLVTRDTTAQLLQMLSEEEIDIGFIQDLDNFNFDLPFQNLFNEPYVALLPKDHHLAKLIEIPFEELIQNRMILNSDPCDIRASFRAVCNALGKHPDNWVDLEMNDSIQTFVLQNYGVSIVPEMTVSHLFHPLLVSRPIISPFPFYRTIGMAIRSEQDKELFDLIKS